MCRTTADAFEKGLDRYCHTELVQMLHLQFAAKFVQAMQIIASTYDASTTVILLVPNLKFYFVHAFGTTLT